MLARYDRGETITLKLSITDSAGAAYDPNVSIQVSIWDPDGTAVVADTAMTKDATGEYHYDLATTASFALGTYRFQYETVHDSRTTIQTDYFVVTTPTLPEIGWSVETLADQLRSEVDQNLDAAGGRVARRDKKIVRELGSRLWNLRDWRFRRKQGTLTIAAGATTGTMPTDFKELDHRVMRCSGSDNYRLFWTEDVSLWQRAKDLVGHDAGASVPRVAVLEWTGSVWQAKLWPEADDEYAYEFWYLTRDPWRGDSPITDSEIMSAGYWPVDFDEGWYNLCAYRILRGYRGDEAWKDYRGEFREWLKQHQWENDETLSDALEPIEDGMPHLSLGGSADALLGLPGGRVNWYGST